MSLFEYDRFKLKHITGLFPYYFLYFIAKFKYVRTGSTALVYDKSAVLFADHCSAAAESFQSALIYEKRSIAALRTLECASGTRIFEGLL